MTTKDLEELYDYGYWANKRLIHVISQLTPEEFTQPVAGHVGSHPQHNGSCPERGMGLAQPLRRPGAGGAAQPG